MNLYYYHKKPDSLLWGDKRLLVPEILRDELSNVPNAAKNPKYQKAALKANSVNMLVSHGAGDTPLIRNLVLQSDEDDQIMYLRTMISHGRGYAAYESAPKFERFPELEPLLYNDPELAFDYAKIIVRGRFIEAEPYIMKDPTYAYHYAADVIKDEWPEAEPYIVKDTPSALNYSSYLSRRRLPEAELSFKKEVEKIARDNNMTVHELMLDPAENFKYHNIARRIDSYMNKYPESEDVILS